MKAQPNLRLREFTLLFVALVFLASCSKGVHHDLLIADVNIVDVKTGEILNNRWVAIDADTISAVYEESIKPSGTTVVIDGSGKFLIPGLWDMHTHYNMIYEETTDLQIAHGITGVREMWGVMALVNEIRNRTQSGEIDAPDMYTAGVIIDGEPEYWPGSRGVAKPGDAEQVVEGQVERGVDFIKVYSNLTPEAFRAIADKAREKGVPFAGHVPQSVSIYEAIAAGMASSEHLYGIAEATSADLNKVYSQKSAEAYMEAFFETFDQKKLDSVAMAIAESQMWLCPTLITTQGYAHMRDSASIHSPRLEYVTENLKAAWLPGESFMMKDADDDLFNFFLKEEKFGLMVMPTLIEKKVKFLAGSDFPNPFCYPGFSLHDELALFVDTGMTELQSLQTATLNPALFMGREEELGSVQEGKRASLVLLNGNPLEDISNTREIEAVILRGTYFDRQSLDEKLQNTRSFVSRKTYSSWLEEAIPELGVEKALDSMGKMIAAGNSDFRTNESSLNALGYKLLRAGDIEDAQAVFAMNMELFPLAFNTYDSYAESLLKGGKPEQALSVYRKVLEFNPDFGGAIRKVDSLQAVLEK